MVISLKFFNFEFNQNKKFMQMTQKGNLDLLTLIFKKKNLNSKTITLRDIKAEPQNS